MSEVRTKSNKKFMLLSAIGIFMVVDHHTFTALNIFGDYLPYNSFFMPMFVFISGYFNKVDGSTNLWKYLIKKLRTLLVPYIGLSLTVFAIQKLIECIKLGSEREPLPDGYLAFALQRIITKGSFGAIVAPMWFVITLFAALMLYALLRKFLDKIWNSFVMFALFCALHIFVIYLAKTADIESMEYLLVPLKCLFFFPFIELGVIYRDHLEKKHSAAPAGMKIGLMFLLLAINAVRTVYLPAAYDIAFDSIDDLSGFTSPYFVTPLVSSLIGILFWLTFAELVGKQVGESKFVNYMSCNTFWIMGLHISFFNIFNCILMWINDHIVPISGFDVEAFKDTEWYFWEIGGNIKILYVLAGILGPLGLKFVFDKASGAVNHRFDSMGSASKAAVMKSFTKPAFVLLFVLMAGFIMLQVKPGIPSEDYQTEPTAEQSSVEETDSSTSGNEDVNPVYAYIGLDDYMSAPCPVYGNETYTVTIRRGDEEEASRAIDGLSSMSIRILDDDASDVDISAAQITGVKVMCDGVELKVDESETVKLDDGSLGVFFDCYEADAATHAKYDFKGRSEIQIMFNVVQAKRR